MENYVEFNVKHTVSDVEINGIMYLDEADDERPLRFYDNINNESWYMPSNPYDADHNYDYWLDYELVMSAIECCDLVQYLVDFANEHKEITLDEPTDGGKILLTIN